MLYKILQNEINIFMRSLELIGNLILKIAIFGLLSSIFLLLYLFVKYKIFSLNKVWDLVVAGNKLARIYFVFISLSFIGATFSVILMRMGI
jgi:hypothetical protein